MPDASKPSRRTLNPDYWYLCLECGTATLAVAWTFWRYDDEGDGTALIQSEDGDDANLCPACGHLHRDDDSGAGIMDGTRAQCEVYRADEAADPTVVAYWTATLAEAGAADS